MKILVLVTRYPWPNTKGDQQRAWSWITALSVRHQVTVLTTGTPEQSAWRESLAGHATVIEAPAAPFVRATSALAGLTHGLPAQVGWMMPVPAWQKAQRLAGRHDVVLAMTVRALRGDPRRPCVVDHVDALSLNMKRRAQGPERPPIRWAAAIESRRLARWERRVAGFARGQIATALEDAGALVSPPRIEVIPVGLDTAPFDEPAGHVRDLDVILTGNMRYPPNRAAAETLARDVLPLVRRVRPVRAAVVGRAASTLHLEDVEVHSDVPVVADFLRRARVAVAPLEGGTGTPYKVLEAAAAGAALVTAPWAAERFAIAAATATDPAGYAEQIVAFLDDEQRRIRFVREARTAVEAHRSTALAARVERLLEEAVSPSRRAGPPAASSPG